MAAAAALVTLQRFTSRFATAGGSGSAPSSEVSGPGAGRSGKVAAYRSTKYTANAIANAAETTRRATDAGVKSAASMRARP